MISDQLLDIHRKSGQYKPSDRKKILYSIMLVGTEECNRLLQKLYIALASTEEFFFTVDYKIWAFKINSPLEFLKYSSLGWI